MRLHSKLLAISSLWAFCAVALPSIAATGPARLSDLKTQLSSLSTMESKLEFLKTALRGQSAETKAIIGAAVIQSAPAATQKQIASHVAQILAELKDGDGPSDTAKLAGLLTSKLPRNLAPSLAGSIAIGAGLADPQHLPQITAAVIVSQSATIAQAGPIAAEVTAFAPLSKASSIASAIGAAYVDHPDLVTQAPQIAADMARAILAKPGTVEQIRPELANTVAVLTVLLPGSIRSNAQLITNIGKAVAAVVVDHPAMATTVVAITAGALKSAAGSSDILPVLNSFRDAFKDSINDPIIQDKLDKVVTDINSGNSDKAIKPLEGHSQSDDTPPPNFGPVDPQETPFANH